MCQLLFQQCRRTSKTSPECCHVAVSWVAVLTRVSSTFLFSFVQRFSVMGFYRLTSSTVMLLVRQSWVGLCLLETEPKPGMEEKRLNRFLLGSVCDEATVGEMGSAWWRALTPLLLVLPDEEEPVELGVW